MLVEVRSEPLELGQLLGGLGSTSGHRQGMHTRRDQLAALPA